MKEEKKMKKTKIKTYVITLSKNYMKGHPKEGQPTNFKENFLSGEKIHTIRGNYDLWKKRLDDVRDRKAILSIRQWEGKPYRSPQIEIAKITSASCCGVQHISLWKPNENDIYWQINDRKTNVQLHDVAKNDGLDIEDFRRWFIPKKDVKDFYFEGAIIHFTPFRYWCYGENRIHDKIR